LSGKANVIYVTLGWLKTDHAYNNSFVANKATAFEAERAELPALNSDTFGAGAAVEPD